MTPYRDDDSTRAVGCALLAAGIMALLATAGICTTLAHGAPTMPATGGDALDGETGRTLEYLSQAVHLGLPPDGYEHEPYLPDAMRRDALRVLPCENRSLDPRAVSATNDHGLFQLNRKWQEGRADRMGYTWEQMLEPGPNIVVATAIWKEQGFGAWSCGKLLGVR